MPTSWTAPSTTLNALDIAHDRVQFRRRQSVPNRHLTRELSHCRRTHPVADQITSRLMFRLGADQRVARPAVLLEHRRAQAERRPGCRAVAAGRRYDQEHQEHRVRARFAAVSAPSAPSAGRPGVLQTPRPHDLRAEVANLEHHVRRYERQHHKEDT